MYAQARAVERNLPDIPLTYLAGNELPPNPKMVAAIRELQREFVDRFSPGQLMYLDVPLYRKPEITDRISREIERVIAATEAS